MSKKSDYILEVSGITKKFGSTFANDHTSLNLKKGEVVALFGENGSGKTTLINVLNGIYLPDSGSIKINGKNVSIKSPAQAIDYGIGTVHQHFKLVDVFDCLDNIMMYCSSSFFLNKKFVEKKSKEICDQYDFNLDLRKKVIDLSVSQKQQLEILKILFTKSDILIFDEPTAVLTPQETASFLQIIKKMQKNGKSIIFISHKLDEVFSISDRIWVLRKGRTVAEFETSNIDKKQLTEAMVGQSLDLKIQKTNSNFEDVMLDIKNLTLYNNDQVKRLDDVNLKIYKGEIFGIAGIADSGQAELCACISGYSNYDDGLILYYGLDDKNPIKIKDIGPKEVHKLRISLGFVPEDRMEIGLVGDYDLVQNILIRSYKDGPTFLLDINHACKLADSVVDKLSVDTPSIFTPVKNLSGGNAQKVLIGREMQTSPKLLLSLYPVRGIDVKTSKTIFDIFETMKKNNRSVIFVGEDLDTLLALSDRILVMYNGKANFLAKTSETSKDEIGYYMVNENKNMQG